MHLDIFFAWGILLLKSCAALLLALPCLVCTDALGRCPARQNAGVRLGCLLQPRQVRNCIAHAYLSVWLSGVGGLSIGNAICVNQIQANETKSKSTPNFIRCFFQHNRAPVPNRRGQHVDDVRPRCQQCHGHQIGFRVVRFVCGFCLWIIGSGNGHLHFQSQH